MSSPLTIFWHRRDLRFTDNAGLYHALKAGGPVQPIFLFDREILDQLPTQDARVEFIHRSLAELAAVYQTYGSDLWIFYGKPVEVWKDLCARYPIGAVYANRDYEPYAIARDQAVADLVAAAGGTFLDFKDHVVFESEEVQKQAGGPYTVFTPYWRKWQAQLAARTAQVEGEEVSFYLQPYPTGRYAGSLHQPTEKHPLPPLTELGFAPTGRTFPSPDVSTKVLKNYDKTRDFPAVEGTSQLSVHLRHGTVSIREAARQGFRLNETFLKELAWRDFYSNILQAFPRVVDAPFRPEYQDIPWRNDEEEFASWCAGRTGVPIVDAGMRQLNETGWMHNRVRMITASYLTKHLLIDWRWGEAYFAEQLLDYELASNNGGWQWAAGCGTDAQPYFRIFNYERQQQRFDKDYAYVKRWVPEYGTTAYPAEPLVEHKFGRDRALRVYKEALALARG